MFRDTDGRNTSDEVLPKIEELDSTVHDSELVSLCSDLLQSTEHISQQMTELAAWLRPDIGPAIVSQDIVDSLTNTITSEQSGAVGRFAELFQSLNKRSNNAPNQPDCTYLRDGVGSLVFTGVRGREASRRSHGGHLLKTRQLLEFWEQDTVVLSPLQLQSINRTIVDPIKRVSDQDKAIAKADSTLMERAEQMLQLRGQIDPTTNLETAKFLVFSSIVDCMKQPTILAAYQKMSKGRESSEEVSNSPFGSYYRAALYLESLTSRDFRKMNSDLDLIHVYHVKGRLGIPSREFRDVFNRLKELSDTYTDLVWSEHSIKEISRLESGLRTLIVKSVKSEADSVGDRAVNALHNAVTGVATRHNARLDQTDITTEAVDEIWQDSLGAESVVLATADFLLTKLIHLGLVVNSDNKTILQAYRDNPWVSISYQRFKETIQDRQIQPEIEDRLAEFERIDSQYILSNKKLRERQPGLITLARQLSESLTDHDPLIEDTSRALVGLMTGVYWERTGKNANSAALAEAYLQDAEQLRQLSSELADFGRPQSSRLLRLTNLLDELIDSGLFDNTRKHPELGVFVDFVLNYIDVRDGEASTETPEDEPDVDGPKVEEPVVPVDSLRQATFEDIKVFPPSATAGEIIREYGENLEEADLPLIEWERIQKLIELRDQYIKQDLETTFIRTKHASWQVLPFFVLEVRLPNDEHSVAVIESPVYGNATYIFSESDDRLPWRDIVQLSKQEAREWGAVPAVHVDSKQLDRHFKKIWDRVISELTVLR